MTSNDHPKSSSEIPTTASGRAARLDYPEALKKAAQGAEEISGRIRAAGNHPSDETVSAAASFSGVYWEGELGKILRTVDERWRDRSWKLAGSCSYFGSRCRYTYSSHIQTEVANTRTHKEIQRQIEKDFD